MFTLLVMNPIFFLLPIFVVVFIVLFCFAKSWKSEEQDPLN